MTELAIEALGLTKSFGDTKALDGVDLAARRGENPVTERGHHLLRAVASSGDLHAAP